MDSTSFGDFSFIGGHVCKYIKKGQERIEKWKRATYQTNLGLSTRRPGPGPAHILLAKGGWGMVLFGVGGPQGLPDPLPTHLAPILHVAAHSYSLRW